MCAVSEHQEQDSVTLYQPVTMFVVMVSHKLISIWMGRLIFGDNSSFLWVNNLDITVLTSKELLTRMYFRVDNRELPDGLETA